MKALNIPRGARRVLFRTSNIDSYIQKLYWLLKKNVRPIQDASLLITIPRYKGKPFDSVIKKQNVCVRFCGCSQVQPQGAYVSLAGIKPLVVQRFVMSK
ncbi:unnamed protein product [Prunus armeniaca]